MTPNDAERRQAARRLLESGVAVTLAPFELSAKIALRESDLDLLDASADAASFLSLRGALGKRRAGDSFERKKNARGYRRHAGSPRCRVPGSRSGPPSSGSTISIPTTASRSRSPSNTRGSVRIYSARLGFEKRRGFERGTGNGRHAPGAPRARAPRYFKVPLGFGAWSKRHRLRFRDRRWRRRHKDGPYPKRHRRLDARSLAAREPRPWLPHVFCFFLLLLLRTT